MRTVVGGALLAVLASCAPATVKRPVVELDGPTMGATWSVTIVSPRNGAIDRDARAALQRTIQATLAQIERLLSTWDAASELSRFNASTSVEPFPVAPETYDVFQRAVALWTETEGIVDPTVAPLVDAWGFGVNRSVPPPDAATVERLRADVGLSLIELDPAGAWVRKRRPGVRCTFSALAPGYAADRIASELTARGYTNFLIDVGGELVARGHNAEGRAWRVAIERPQGEGRSIERVVSLDNQAISTSGDYRNFREVASGRLPHILDPRTGVPVQHALASASVIAEAGVRADGLSTALMVMGPDDALSFARAHNLPALLLVRTGDGRLEERMSPTFPRTGR